MTYLSREQFLGRIQRLEDDYTLANGTKLRIRELLAEDRLIAQELGDPDPETRQYRDIDGLYTYIVQRGVIDPQTGEPLFAPTDIAAFRTARMQGLAELKKLGDAIWFLSEADPDSFRTPRDAADQPGDADPSGGPADSPGGDRANPGRTRDGDLGADGADSAGRPARRARKRAAAAADVARVDPVQGA